MLTHGDTRCFCHSSNYTKMNILNYLFFCHWFCKMKWLVSRLDMICIKLDYLEALLFCFVFLSYYYQYFDQMYDNFKICK